MLRPIAFQTAAAGFNAAVSVALLLLLARWLGPDAFAIYSAVLSGAVLALVVIDGGWSTLLFRDGSGQGGVEHHRVGRAVGHVLATGALMLTALALAWTSLSPTLRESVAAALLCMCTIALGGLVTSQLRARGRFESDAYWQMALRLGSAGGIIAGGLIWALTPALVFLAWAVAIGVLLAAWGRRWLATPRLEGWRSSLGSIAPFAAYEAGFMVLTRGDVAVLGILDAGLGSLTDYAAGARLNEGWLLLFTPVAAVLLRSFRLELATPPRAQRLLRHALVAAVSLGAAASALVWWQGSQVLTLVFGEAYGRSGPLAAFTSLALPFMLGNVVAFSALMARKSEAQLVRVILSAAALLPVAMAAGLRLAGPEGAAIGLACVHASVLLACLWLLRSQVSEATPEDPTRAAAYGHQLEVRLPTEQSVLLGCAPMNARLASDDLLPSPRPGAALGRRLQPWVLQGQRPLLLMPAYNEQDSIADVVMAARAAIQADVLVVSDDSTDDTAARAPA
jgi:O-antigen/teichoic acid export membrane protein